MTGVDKNVLFLEHFKNFASIKKKSVLADFTFFFHRVSPWNSDAGSFIRLIVNRISLVEIRSDLYIYHKFQFILKNNFYENQTQ